MSMDRTRKSLTNLNIILDIDETLVHTFESRSILDVISKRDSRYCQLRRRMYSFRHRDFNDDNTGYTNELMIGVKRPYLDDFIEFCFFYFDHVIIWSAGLSSYVNSMCKKIFKRNKPFLILARDKCEGDLYAKPITLLSEHPALKNIITLKNTLIIDDKTVSLANNPSNGVTIPAYQPSSENPEEILSDTDDCLLKLLRWFQWKDVLLSDDVRTLDKSLIFI